MAHSVSRDGAKESQEADVGTGGNLEVAQPSLRSRRPGQVAIGELLRVHAAERPRSSWGRLFGISPVGAESQPWFAATVGELAVGELLSRLGAAWTVLHAVPVGPGSTDIDHVVIGPGGIFTITTRNHPGLEIAVSGRTVVVAGMKIAHIRDAEHDLGRAERLLSAALGEMLAVTGLLVFVEPKVLSSRQVPKDLEVLSSNELLSWLEARPELLDAAEVERIAKVAELASTWGTTPEADDGKLEQRELDMFLRLVDRSRTLRQLWFGTVTMLIIVTATALATFAIVGLVPDAIAR